GRRPRVAEVVLGPRSEQTGEALAVDVDLLVAFAPPGRVGRVLDVQQRSHQVALALDAGQVPVTERARPEDLAGPPSGVEQQTVLPERRASHVDRSGDVDRAGIAACDR